jgi:hypothetical protein
MDSALADAATNTAGIEKHCKTLDRWTPLMMALPLETWNARLSHFGELAVCMA